MLAGVGFLGGKWVLMECVALLRGGYDRSCAERFPARTYADGLFSRRGVWGRHGAGSRRRSFLGTRSVTAGVSASSTKQSKPPSFPHGRSRGLRGTGAPASEGSLRNTAQVQMTVVVVGVRPRGCSRAHGPQHAINVRLCV